MRLWGLLGKDLLVGVEGISGREITMGTAKDVVRTAQHILMGGRMAYRSSWWGVGAAMSTSPFTSHSLLVVPLLHPFFA